jgi:hypothetical protein
MPGPKKKDQDENSGRELEKHVDQMYGRTDEDEEETEDKDEE